MSLPNKGDPYPGDPDAVVKSICLDRTADGHRTYTVVYSTRPPEEKPSKEAVPEPPPDTPYIK